MQPADQPPAELACNQATPYGNHLTHVRLVNQSLQSRTRSRKHYRPTIEWLRRYLDEKEPALKNFAEIVRSLEGRAKGSLPE